MTRREWLSLIGSTGSALLLAACGKSSPPSVTAVTTGTSGPDSPTPATSAGSSSAVSPAGSSSAVIPSAASSSPVPPASTPAAASRSAAAVVTGGRQSTSAAPMDAAQAQRSAAASNGRWLGAWHDDAGRSGQSDVTIVIDPAGRSGQATLALTGPFLGGTVPDTTYAIFDLASFLLAGNGYDVNSPQFGRVHIEPSGSGATTATATDLPGHPEIRRMTARTSRLSRRLDMSYTLELTSGQSVKGTAAWSGTDTRAVPAKLDTAASPADIQTGVYAAGLLDAAALTAALGTPCPAPTPNGGRRFYANGIDVSNAQAASTSGKYSVEYSVYLGTTPTIAGFYATQARSATPVSGPWKAGSYLDSIGTLYCYVPTRDFEVRVIDLQISEAPTAAQTAALKQLAVAVGSRLAKSVSS